MKKKYLALLLSGIMSIMTLAGCGKAESTNTGNKIDTKGKTADELLLEKYENPVKVKVVLGYRDSENPDTPKNVTPQTQTAVKQLKDKLNIELEYDWIVNADQYDQKFGAELAAGRLPDIMFLKPNQFQDLMNQGALADITEIYNTYANDEINAIVNYDGKVLDVAKKDGKIYGLFDGQYSGMRTSQIYYDMNKLKEVGITDESQLPKTIAEFEALCDKLMKADIDGDGKTGEPVLPVGKYSGTGLAEFGPFYQAYETNTTGWYDDGTGNLISPLVENNMKSALTKLNEWYGKGYFKKDFAAYDVFAADSSIVSDIVAGEYAIVPGSWWIPNWPLNMNKENKPESDWIVGPTLTVDGKSPKLLVNRVTVSGMIAVRKGFEHPEALFKMIKWGVDYGNAMNNPEYRANRTPEQKLENDSYVYHWLPYKTFATMTLVENYEFIRNAEKQGITEVTPAEAPKNAEFWDVWNANKAYKNGDKDPNIWGRFVSRTADNGGVAKMYELFEKSEKRYNEVYVNTPTMVKKQGELDKYSNTTILSMVMGETPLSQFEAFAKNWMSMGGTEIQKEVNEWYKNK